MAVTVSARRFCRWHSRWQDWARQNTLLCNRPHTIRKTKNRSHPVTDQLTNQWLFIKSGFMVSCSKINKFHLIKSSSILEPSPLFFPSFSIVICFRINLTVRERALCFKPFERNMCAKLTASYVFYAKTLNLIGVRFVVWSYTILM